MKSFKVKVLVSVTSIVTFAIFITIVIIGFTTMKDFSKSLEENALSMMESMKINVDSVYTNIEKHSSDLLEHRKRELEHNTSIIMSIVNEIALNSKEEGINSEEAKLKAIETIKTVRYDNGIGYFWINDIQRPYPKMIMHPTLPELDGQILDDESFFVTKDTGENLFKVFVDVVLEDTAGYVEYLWPKPTEQGLTKEQPKLSYVRLFEEWNWVIGTGVYIDDIEAEAKVNLLKAIDDLNNMLSMQRVGESGYYFIFNEDFEILIHPSLSGTNGRHLLNPETQEPLLNELMNVASKEENYLEYLWNKPSDKNRYIYDKKSYITYYEPLGWYLASSYYNEDLTSRVKTITRKLINYSILIILMTFATSVLLIKSLLKPLNALIGSIKDTEKGALPLSIDVHGKTTEILLLEDTINEMVDSIKVSKEALYLTNAKLQSIMDSATLVSIIATNLKGTIEVFNTGAERMLGYKADDLINKETPKLFHLEEEIIEQGKVLSKIYGEEIEGFDVFTKKSMMEGYEEREWTYVKKNNEKICVNLSVTPIYGAEREIVGFLGAATDVTQRKDAEKKLKHKSRELVSAIAELKEQEEHLEEMVKERTIELEESLRALSDAQDRLVESEKLASLGGIVAGVAHEINTPVGSSITLSSNLNEKVIKLKSKLAENHLTKSDLNSFIDVVEESSKLIFNNMERTANLVRSFKLVAADQSSGIRRTINLYEYLKEILKSFGSQLDRASVEVEIDYEGEMDLDCHPGALYQIFTNLIMNSLKHGFENRDQGKIDFSINTTSDEVIIKYRDNGIGIKKEFKDKIFDPFFTTKRADGGTGLGLNIAYNLIHQKLNGNIVCTTESGEYTEFEIKFPKNISEK